MKELGIFFPQIFVEILIYFRYCPSTVHVAGNYTCFYGIKHSSGVRMIEYINYYILCYQIVN